MARTSQNRLNTLRLALHHGVSSLAIFAVIVGQIAPVFADGLAPLTQTTITGSVVDGYDYDARIDSQTQGGTFNITGRDVGNHTDLMVYNTFELAANDQVKFNLNANAQRIVNIMNGTSGAVVEGNIGVFQSGAVALGGEVYFVTPGGFVLGERGVIQAGRLVITSPNTTFRDQMVNASKTGDMSDELAQINRGDARILEGGGAIEIRGKLEARQLSLQAGTRLMLNGQITVTGSGAADSGYLTPSGLNVGKVDKAAGVQVRDGVISLLSAREISLAGEITARNDGAQDHASVGGAAITARAKTITVKMDEGNTRLVAEAAESARPSYIIMFGEDSVLIEKGVKIEAKTRDPLADGTSVVWIEGGEVGVGATGSSTARGVLGGQKDAIVMLRSADNVAIGGAFDTHGADLVVVAPEEDLGLTEFLDSPPQLRVELDGADIRTAGGDVLISAQHISAENAAAGRQTIIDTTDAAGSGLLVLSAKDSYLEEGWPITLRSASASITLKKATLSAGSVVISAVAQVSNIPRTETLPVSTVEKMAEDYIKLADAFWDQFSESPLPGSGTVLPGDPNGTARASLGDIFDELLQMGLDSVKSGAVGSAQAIANKLMVSIPITSASAVVTIEDSKIASDGSWRKDEVRRLPARTEVSSLDDDFGITDTGLYLDNWDFNIPDLFGDVILQLPADWGPLATIGPQGPEHNQAREDIYIRAHADNLIEALPAKLLPMPVGVGVAKLDTTSKVIITGASELQSTRDMGLRSTVRESLAMTVQGAKLGGVTTSFAISLQNVENRLFVDAKRITAGGTLGLAAQTIRSHDVSTYAQAGTDDTLAVALGVGISKNLTEAAVNARASTTATRKDGGITVGGDIDLQAQTLFTSSNRSAEAIVGLTDPEVAIYTKNAVTGPLITKIKGTIKEALGFSPESSKPSFGLGFGVDINVFDDQTYASLGGRYYDSAAPDSFTAFEGGTVTLPGQANLSVRSELLYHSGTLVGGPTRNASAKIAEYSAVIRARTLAANHSVIGVPNELIIGEDEVIGQYSDAVLVGLAASYLGSTTEAALGGDILIEAAADPTAVQGNINVAAETDFGSPVTTINALWDSVQDWKNYVTTIATLEELPLAPDVNDISDVPGNVPGNPEDYAPDLPEIDKILGSLTSVTSGATALAQRTTSQSASDKGQNLAVGASFNGYMSNANTKALILDNAVIRGAEAVEVNAVEKGISIFTNNFPVLKNPVSGPSADAIGGTLGVQVNRGTIAATVGKATIHAKSLAVQADNDRFFGQIVYAGRGGRETGVSIGLGGNVTLKTTKAELSGEARVTLAENLDIVARDETVNWGVALGFSGAHTDGKGTTPPSAVGTSLIVNVMERDVGAGITDNNALKTGKIVVNGAATIRAQNSALDIAVALAGAATSDTPAAVEPPGVVGEALEQIKARAAAEKKKATDDLAVLLKRVMDPVKVDELLGKGALNVIDTAPAEGVQSRQTGLTLAGAAAANVMLANKTRVNIGAGVQLQSAGAVNISAKNSGLSIAGAGAVSASLQTKADTNAMGGSLSFTFGSRDVTAMIAGEVTSTAGNVHISAADENKTVNVAVGAAGATKGQKVVAGSVGMNVLTGATKVTLLGANVTARAGTVRVNAADTSWQLAIGGGISVNMNMQEGFGFGLGIGSNNYARDTLVDIKNQSVIDGHIVDLAANFEAKLYGFGISAGVGKTGVAGSASVNTILADAKITIEGAAAANEMERDVVIRAQEAFKAAAKDHAEIWSLAGALAIGKENAVGAAGTVNVVTGTTEVKADYLKLIGAGATGAEFGAQSLSRVRSMAVAAALAGNNVAVGAGITVNVVSVDAGVRITHAHLERLGDVTAKAESERDIASLAGGAAGSTGKGAGGAAMAVNTIASNDTVVEIHDTAVDAARLDVGAQAKGRIISAAVALSASTGAAVAGSVSVNVITGSTRADILRGTISRVGEVTQSAIDSQTIKSLAGNVALGLREAAVGVAVSVNVIAQTTQAHGTYRYLSDSLVVPKIAIKADNKAVIKGLGATAAVAGGNAGVGASVAIGDIGNTASAVFEGAVETADTVSVIAENNSRIDVLAGAVGAAFGGAGVGAAVSLAMIHDTTEARLESDTLAKAAGLTVSAFKQGVINAAALGLGGGSGVGVGASLVYTMIGRESVVAGLSEAHSNGDTSSTDETIRDADRQRNSSWGDLTSQTDKLGGEPVDEDGSHTAAMAGLQTKLAATKTPTGTDRTEAKLTLGTAGDFGAISVTAEDKASVASLAGSAGVAGGVGVGAGITVNLMFGSTKAALALASGQNRAGAVSVKALQTGNINTHAYSLGAGASVGVAGAITVNLMQRGLFADVSGASSDSRLQTNGQAVRVEAVQTGTADSIAGVLAAGAGAGVGAAISVNYVADTVATSLKNLNIDTTLTSTSDLAATGKVSLIASSTLAVRGSAASVAVGGIGGVGGAVVVNIGGGKVGNYTSNVVLAANDLEVLTTGSRNITAYTGAVSAGLVGVGLAVSVNASSVEVLSEHKGLRARLDGNGRVETKASAQFGGVAVGLAGAGVAVVGTSVANRSVAVAKTMLTSFDTTAGPLDSQLLARGSLAIVSDLSATSTLDGGEREIPAVAGGAAGGFFAGAGVSVSVNTFKGQALTQIDDGTRLAALGQGSPLNAVTKRGLTLSAQTNSVLKSATVIAATGIGAGAAATSTIVLGDMAEVRIGDLDANGVVARSVSLNEDAQTDDLLSQLGYAQGVVERGHAAQDTIITAKSISDIDAKVGIFGAGVGAGGAAVSVTVAENIANVRLAGVSLAANRDIEITADVDNTVTGQTVGVAAGVGNYASTISTRIFNAQATVSLYGVEAVARPTPTTGSALTIRAATNSASKGEIGSVSGAAVGGAGTILVTQSTNTAEVTIGSVKKTVTGLSLEDGQPAVGADLLLSDVDGHSDLSANGKLAILAQNDLDFGAKAAAGGFGLFGSMTTVSQTLLVSSSAKVSVDDRQSLEARGALEIGANDEVTSHSRAGAISAAGLAAIGAVIDIQRFEGDALVQIGANVRLRAGGNLTLAATAQRDIDVGVVSGSAGGLAGLALALSSVDIGGTLAPESDEDKARKAKAVLQVKTALAKVATTSGDPNAAENTSKNRAQALNDANYAQAMNRAAALDLDAALGADTAQVSIGQNARLSAGANILVDAKSLIDLTQETGALGVGLVGAASGTGLANVAGGAAVRVADQAELNAAGLLKVAAQEGSLSRGIVSTVHSLGAGAYAASVGVGLIDVKGQARVEFAGVNRLEGGLGPNAGVHISATRDMATTLTVKNHTFALASAVGVAVGHVNDSGLVRVLLGPQGEVAARDGVMSGNSITFEAMNKTRQTVAADAATGGLLGLSGTGVDARATSTASAVTSIRGYKVRGHAVTLKTEARPTVEATAKGVSIGTLTIGMSLAKAELGATVTTDFASDIEAQSIRIETALRGDGTRAEAHSSAGGLGAGSGALAQSLGAYAVAATIDGNLRAKGGDLVIVTSADTLRFDALASGKAGGVVAVGAVTAIAGNEGSRKGSVTLNIMGSSANSSMSARDDVIVHTTNAPGYGLDAAAGAAGVGAGTAVDGKTFAKLETTANFKVVPAAAPAVKALEIYGGTVSLQTVTRPEFTSKVDSRSASLVGHSGARQASQITIDSAMNIGAQTTVFGLSGLDMMSYVKLDRSGTLYAGSGGLASGAAARSTVTTDVTNIFDVASGAHLEMGSLGGLSRPMSLAVLNDYAISERADLNSDGAIAMPRAEIEINATRSTAFLNIGAADLLSDAGLRVSSGNQVQNLAYANVTTTGLAGAAAGHTKATFNGDNAITIATGAILFAEENLELLAGYAAGTVQVFDLQAETRLYNRTALPINTQPDADARANDTSRVVVNAGADLKAVRDITVAAEGGARLVRGYGLGKDLYLEVLAEIASAISGIFGGGPVSLDIKGGSTLDNGHHGLVLNGNLRAGARNIQVLYFNEQHEAHYGEYAFAATDTTLERLEKELAQAQTIYDVATLGGATKALRARLREVEGWLADPELTSNGVAKLSWQMEVDRLNREIALVLQSSNGTQIEVGDIRASAGNIALRGQYATGTGRLVAPHEAKIVVDAQLRETDVMALANMTIDNHAGGTISFNGTAVRDNAMIGELTVKALAGRAAAFNLTSSESSTVKPSIVLDAGSGIMMVRGDIFNLGGSAHVVGGNVKVYGQARAAELNIVGASAVSLEYRPGVRSVSGQNPEDSYGAYFTSVENAIRQRVRTGAVGVTTRYTTFIPTFTQAKVSASSGIFAGSSIFIAADMVNINGNIRAGVGAYDVDIYASLDGVLAGLSGTSDILLYDPDTGRGLGGITHHIATNVAVSYDPLSKRIKLADMIALGGEVTIIGDLFSTGNGRIEVLDGFSTVNVNSQSRYALELGRIVLGNEPDAAGNVAGGVGKITLHNFTHGLNGSTSTASIYTRASMGGLRQTTFQPLEGRDYIYTTVTETTTVRTMQRKELRIFGGTVDESRSTLEITHETVPAVNVKAAAPYLGASLGGADYAYAVEGTLLSKSNVVKSAVEKTHDSVKWYKGYSGWRHYEWTETHHTVERFEHRVKADYAVKIVFAGVDAPLPSQAAIETINVNSRGSVIFGAIVNNYGGTSTVSSTAGSITAASTSLISGRDMTFRAAAGAVGSAQQAVSLNLFGGAAVSASARDSIHLAAPKGDLLLGTIATSRQDDRVSEIGAVRLSARGAIDQTAGGLITSGDLYLQSATRGISGQSGSLRVNTQKAGRVFATASDSVAISETLGDLQLGTIKSAMGSVTLTALDGAILDGLNDVVHDFRTTDELVAIWRDDLGLTDANSARIDQLIATEEAEYTQLYAQYWDAREALLAEHGGAPDAPMPANYEISAATRQALEAAGASAADIAAYEAKRAAIWRSFDADGRRDATYVYALSAADQDVIRAATVFNESQLKRSLDANVVRRNTGSQTQIETDNVTAYGSITMTARDGVGRNIADHIIDVEQAGFSDTDLHKLSGAMTHNIKLVDFTDHLGTRKRIHITQFEDVNVAFKGGVDASTNLGTGTLNITSTGLGGNVFVASAGGIRVGHIRSQGGVTLRAQGHIGHARAAADPTIDIEAAGDLVLEADDASLTGEGQTAMIGAANNRLRVKVVGKASGETSVTALTAADDMWLEAVGDLSLASVYGTGLVDLLASGAVTDAYTSAVPRVIGRQIALTAGSLGTAAQKLGLEIEPADGATERMGTITLRATAGDMNVATYEDAIINRADATGAINLAAMANLSVIDQIKARGHVTMDVVGHLGVETRLPRLTPSSSQLAGSSLSLTVGTLGLSATPMVLEQTDTVHGLSRLITRTGPAYGTFISAVRLAQMQLATGGLVTVEGNLALVGADVVRFGAQDLELVLKDGLNLSAATGTDITGSRLKLLSATDIGVGADRLETALAQLTGHVNGQLHLSNTGALAVDTITAGRVLDLRSTGALSTQGLTEAGSIVLSTLGSLTLAGEAMVARDLLSLFAAGGTISTAPSLGARGASALSADQIALFTAYASGDISLNLGGNATFGYVIGEANVDITVEGALRAKAVQAEGLRLKAATVAINVIGAGEVLRADVSGLGLAQDPIYGLYSLRGSNGVTITADTTIALGLAQVKNIKMTGTHIDAVLMAHGANGHIDATLAGHSPGRGPDALIYTVMNQIVASPTQQALDETRQGLNSTGRDSHSILFTAPDSADAVLYHRGLVLDFDNQEVIDTQYVVRGDETFTFHTLYAGINSASQLDIWLPGGNTRVSYGMHVAGPNLVTNRGLMIETRRAGYIVNGTEILAEQTMRGLSERLSIPNGFVGDGMNAGFGATVLMVPPGFSTFTRTLTHSPLIMGRSATRTPARADEDRAAVARETEGGVNTQL